LSGGTHVVREDDLVHLVERIGPDEGNDLALEADLLLHLAQDTLLGRLALLQEAGDEAVPLLRPALVAHQEDRLAVLDQSGDHRGGVVVEDVAARLARAHEARVPLELAGGQRARA